MQLQSCWSTQNCRCACWQLLAYTCAFICSHARLRCTLQVRAGALRCLDVIFAIDPVRAALAHGSMRNMLQDQLRAKAGPHEDSVVGLLEGFALHAAQCAPTNDSCLIDAVAQQHAAHNPPRLMFELACQLPACAQSCLECMAALFDRLLSTQEPSSLRWTVLLVQQ